MQGTAPSPSPKAVIRSRGEGQVLSATYPAVARPQSRRSGPPLRLFQHSALTGAFVAAAHPQIVNGSSPRPSRSRSAPTGSPPQQRLLLFAAGWQLMVSITYLLVQKEIVSRHCGKAQGRAVSEQRGNISFSNSIENEQMIRAKCRKCCLVGGWGVSHPLHK